MTRIPGSQAREVMQFKREQAQRLLAKGLSVYQVSAQLNCSRAFVRRVRDEMADDEAKAG